MSYNCFCYYCLFFFFFFKQKTAYEMRISDWSSDVCSSDLARTDRGRAFRARKRRFHRRDEPQCGSVRTGGGRDAFPRRDRRHAAGGADAVAARPPDQRIRSEEHTSELQSLMRISYAVFCLKKKKNTNKSHNERNRQNEST